MSNKAKLIATVEALARKRGMSLWTVKLDELALILMAFTQTVGPAETFTEREFSVRLEHWLHGDGEFLRTDFAELRRALVDLGFFARDPSGAVYRRAQSWPVRWRALCTAVQDIALTEVLARARAEEASQRIERKRMALQRA